MRAMRQPRAGVLASGRLASSSLTAGREIAYAACTQRGVSDHGPSPERWQAPSRAARQQAKRAKHSALAAHSRIARQSGLIAPRLAICTRRAGSSLLDEDIARTKQHRT